METVCTKCGGLAIRHEYPEFGEYYTFCENPECKHVESEFMEIFDNDDGAVDTSDLF